MAPPSPKRRREAAGTGNICPLHNTRQTDLHMANTSSDDEILYDGQYTPSVSGQPGRDQAPNQGQQAPTLNIETQILIGQGIVSFEQRLHELKKVIPAEYFTGERNRHHYNPRQAGAAGERLRVSRGYALAIENLYEYKIKGGVFTPEQKEFFDRYYCCRVGVEFADAYKVELSYMPFWDRSNRERFRPESGRAPKCGHCEADHETSEECKKLKQNGPLNVEFLQYRLTGATAEQVLYMGTVTSLYLSADIDFKFKNVGLLDWEKTWYPLHEEELADAYIGYAASLGKKISERTDKAPTVQGAPSLYVEFFPSTYHQGEKLINHLIGFMRVIDQLQKRYEGTIVMVLLPVPPHHSCSNEEFLHHKLEFQRLVRLALFLGDVFCIAVAPIIVQEIPKRGGVWAQHNPKWRREEIFGGRDGKAPTREFQRRIKQELHGTQMIVNKAWIYATR
jgi:hypothetical protein